jgi:TRAP transporter TAXI family solute receptor
MKDGKVDAFFWSGGVPTPSVQDLAATPGTSMTLVRHDELLPVLQQNHGRELYSLAVIPAGTYRGAEEEIGTIGVKNLLVVSSQLDEALVEQITRVLFESKDALVAAHPEARHLAPPSTFDGVPAPYHPGALAFYKRAR